MGFFKLDTRVTAGFEKPLGDELTVFRTGTLSVLRTLFRQRGLVGATKAVFGAITGGTGAQADLIEGNVTRRRIRLPALFDNKVAIALYRRVKMVEAGLLYQALTEHLRISSPDVAIVFNGSNYPESVLATVVREAGLRKVYVEGGFFPKTLQIDPVGLNGANSVPRDPAFYADATRDFAKNGLPLTVNARASKTRGQSVSALPETFVFVPFQVPSDMQVTKHSPWIRDMVMFLDAIRSAADRNPTETFVIKEHPSFKRSVQGLRSAHDRVIFANSNVTSDLILQSRAVVTLNSTVGIEALLLDRPVITLGQACYNIEGLVQHATDAAKLDKALQRTHGWVPDPRLRRQFLGYLWNHYLLHGSYDALPDDLATQLRRRANQDIIL